MTAVLLGLAAAIAYGLSDFAAGIASRRVHYSLVSLIGNGTAFLITVPAVAVLASPMVAAQPTAPALFWGALSGMGGGFGTLMLYRGLGRGRMGVVAPLSALGAAVLPVIIGVALGDQPSFTAWFGIGLALPAIGFVSTSGVRADGLSAREAREGLAAGVVDGLVAGVAFALLFVGLNLAGDESGLWPVAASEASSTALLAVVLLGTLIRVSHGRPRSRDVLSSMLVGVLGAAAVILYFYSTQAGLLSIVAVLTSLYPAATVLLAAIVLREAVTRRQAIGLALAALSVVLIVIG